MSSFIPDQPQSAITASSPFTTEWLRHVSADLPTPQQSTLALAVQRAEPLIHGLYTPAGEPLDSHTAAVLGILHDLNADAHTRICALLSAIEAKDQLKYEVLKNEFGSQVATMVGGARALYDLGVLAAKAHDQAATGTDQKEMKRKMLLAMAVDLRIVLVRLASRLQTLRWFVFSKTPCPYDYAKETMELYTPLANRLGIWQLKWEMEDLAFRFMQPDTYKAIAKQLEEKRAEREQFIEHIVQTLTQSLLEMGVRAEVNGRPKHIYSIYNKMCNKNLRFDQLYDIRALRVIVDDERSCYSTLALIHAMWTPIANEFDDYISRPKPNGYRSLHTVVADEAGRTFEIQIRTAEMHHFAEFGMAAHWHYKEAGAKGGQVSASAEEQKIAWMRQLLAWDHTTDNAGSAAVESTPEHIYVLTPQARVIELPYGATPVDFAYYLHTDLGHRCRGAKVDGHMVPLLTKLKTGQTVEIISTKSGGPSRDWLNPQLGFLASPRSRAKVRAWFNAVELQQRISQGQALVEKELQRLGKTAVNLEQLAQKLNFARADDLYIAVAKDEFSLRHIENAFKAPSDSADAPVTTKIFDANAASVTRTGRSGVLVVGVDSLMTQLARCCRPAPPDSISGYITKGRGVSIHRSDCKSFLGLVSTQPERAIEVDWGNTGDALYPIDLLVSASERPNLLRDISEVFARLRVNVVGVNSQSRQSLTQLLFTIEVKDGEQIQRTISALQDIPGVRALRQ
ncbi:bifunctional (p)ppGpp synthetase/guanosine-3',5'-bis(diphosphate) 3'-pyrophosphohydrolase [Paenalcaligenes hominis]|uniref:RelA/SpoT family protein n=1 Tax=Paenalcaligenes hominis TaxID=643674 RepID=UPI0035231415